MGPQIIWWAKIGPVDDSFHGNSEKMVSDCKAIKAMTHIMTSTSALIILTKFAKEYKD